MIPFEGTRPDVPLIVRKAAVNPRTSIRSAAQRNTDAQRRLKEAVVESHGELNVTELADLAGVTRPTIYAWLHEAGVQLKGTKT